MPISQEKREQIEERLAWFKRKQPPDYDEIYDLVEAVPVLLAALDESDDSLKILRPVLEQYRQVVEEIHSKGHSQAIMDLKKERDRLEKVVTELGSDSALLRVENERIREENTRLASQLDEVALKLRTKEINRAAREKMAQEDIAWLREVTTDYGEGPGSEKGHIIAVLQHYEQMREELEKARGKRSKDTEEVISARSKDDR